MFDSQNRPPYLNAVRLSISKHEGRRKNNLVAVETLKCGKDSLYLQVSRVTRKTRPNAKTLTFVEQSGQLYGIAAFEAT